MLQALRIRRGTRDEFNAYGLLQPGELGFCTDTGEVFIGNGVENYLVGRAMSGALCLWGAVEKRDWGSLESMTWEQLQTSIPA